ncbi:universal stress protein [Acidimicrobium ferrooxidans]|nr:universal stress protein [Acidimicrobium ferrooxidans]
MAKEVVMAERVVVGVDGSDASLGALRWALDEAAIRGATVEAVTAWQGVAARGADVPDPALDDGIAEAARRVLADALQATSVPPGLTVDPVVSEGGPDHVLCDRSIGASLLVVGSRGRGGFERLLLGSVSSACARHAASPLLITRPGHAGDAPPRSGRILVGIDGSDGSRRALAWAKDDARRRGWSVTALSVWSDPYEGDLTFELQAPRFQVDHEVALRAVRERLEAVIDETASVAPSVEVEAVVVGGDPRRELCHHAEDADLLVVGRRGTHSLAALLLGSIATTCAHHAPVPIVIVPDTTDLPQSATDR